MSEPRWPVDPFEVSIPAPVRVAGPASREGSDIRDGHPSDPSVAGERASLDGGGAPTGRGFGSELATLARGGTLTLAGSIASSVLGFLLVVVITRGLHRARAAGVLFEVIALFMILANSTELGADTGLVRLVASYRATGRARDVRPTLAIALWPVLLVSSLAAVAVYVFAPQLSHTFIHAANRSVATHYIRVFAPFIPMASATTVILSGTRGFGTMLPYVAVLNVGVPGLRPFLVVAAVVAGFGATGIALSWTLPAAAGFVAALVWAYALLRRSERRERHSNLPQQPRRSARQLASEFWSFAAPRGLAGFIQVTVIWLNVLLVGALATTKEAGIFAAVNRFTGVGTFALQAIGIALAPQIASLLARREREGAEGIFQTGTWWLMALGWPIYIVMAVFAPFLLRIFGREYVAGQHVLLILALGNLALVGTGNNKVVLLMGGGSGVNLAISTVSLALNIGLNLALIPSLGMNGAAVALAATILFDMTATTVAVWWRLKINPFGTGYLVVALASLACFGALGLAVRSVVGMGIRTFLGFAVLASGTYLLLLWRFRRILRLPALRSSLRMRAMIGAERRR